MSELPKTEQIDSDWGPGPSEPVSPTDPIVHGARWLDALRRIEVLTRPYAHMTHIHEIAREALREARS